MPSRWCIKNPTLGRIVGVIWDIAVSAAFGWAIPLVLGTAAWHLLMFHWLFAPVSLVLLLAALFSFLVGLFWTLRWIHDEL